MFSANQRDQSLLVALGLSGGVGRAAGATDVLSVVSENATPSKGDWYLRRKIRYQVRLDPRQSMADTDLEVKYQNDAPPSGLPDDVIGSLQPDLARGTSRQIAMLVRAPTDELEHLFVDSKVDNPIAEREGSLRSYLTEFETPSMSASTLRATSNVQGAFFGRGRERLYRLEVLPQAVANADQLEITIEAPRGWNVTGRTRFRGSLRRDEVLEVRLRQTWRGWFFEKAVLEPWRLGRRALGRIF
jgi:hypothetical protein